MDKQTRKQFLVFGYGLSVILLFWAFRHWHKHGMTTGVLVAVALAVFFTGCMLLKPDWMKVFFKWWMKAAGMIGWVVTRLILSVIFFLVITPLGLFLRCKGGRGLLELPWDKNAQTYWQERPARSGDVKEYYRQF